MEDSALTVYSHGSSEGGGTKWHRPSHTPRQPLVSGHVSTAPAALNGLASLARPVPLIPDLDVIGFPLGVRYGDFWGHRGFPHAVLFAVLLALAMLFVALRRGGSGHGGLSLWSYFFLATVSHGLGDALTNGGLGVAYFAPFNNHRYFLPWRLIQVSPIGFGQFFTYRGLAVGQSELVWIWLPAALLAVSAWISRPWCSPAGRRPGEAVTAPRLAGASIPASFRAVHAVPGPPDLPQCCAARRPAHALPADAAAPRRN